MRQTDEQTVQFSIEAEMCVLGAALLSRPAQRYAVRHLRPEMFFSEAHRALFGTLSELERQDIPADLVVIKNDLKAKKLLGTKLGKVSLDYLIQVAEAVPSAANVAHYARIVLQKWQQRELTARLDSIGQRIDKGELVSDIRQDIDSLCKNLEVTGDPWRDVSEIPLDDRADIKGVRSGFGLIDRSSTYHGWPGSRTSLIVARTGSGKSLAICQAALEASKQHRVGIVTLELTDEQMKRRMLRQLCGHSQTPSKLDEVPAWDQAISELQWRDILFFDARRIVDAHSVTVERVANAVLDRHERNPIDILFVDHLQKLSTEQRTFSEADRLVAVSLRLARLALQMGIPIPIGSQTTVTDGKLNAKGSRGPEEDAALVVVIDRKADEENGKLRIEKSTHGRSGIEVPIRFDSERLRFVEIEARP